MDTASKRNQRGALRAVCLLALLGASAAHAEPIPAHAGELRFAQPALRWSLDAPVAAGGVGLVILSQALNTTREAIPPGGLDRSGIRLGIDRRSVGKRDQDVELLSTIARDGALAFPMALSVICAPGHERLRAPARRAILYLEAVAIAEGITGVIKRVDSRPRPYAYMSDADRPTTSEYDVNQDQAFQSFPSGHATASWCAASFAITDHWLSRPHAPAWERVAVALCGTALATGSSALRVEAGQHFPSDVAAGAAIGIAAGAGVPLLHEYVTGGSPGRGASRRSCLPTLVGAIAGIAAGLIASSGIAR